MTKSYDHLLDVLKQLKINRKTRY